MATVPPNLDTPDGSDSDSNKDNRFYLLKTNQKNLLGNRENGEPIAFFDEKDLGVIHSSALLQKLSPDEFKFGEAGQLKSSWVSFLKTGNSTFHRDEFKFFGRVVYNAIDYIINWETSVDNSDPVEEARLLELNWVTAVLDVWDTVFREVQNFPTRFSDEIVGDALWVDIKQILENSANTSQFISSKDELETYLELLKNGEETETTLPGSPDTILWSREAYHELDLSPGTLLEEINRIYGSKDVFDTNQGTLKGLADSINVFKDDLEIRIGKVIKGLEVVTGYENSNGEVFESIPDGDDPAEYTSLYGPFSVFDDFQKRVFGETSSDYTLTSGIIYNNDLIKNQTISGLADTPSGNISGMLLVSDGTGFNYVSHTLTGLSDTPTGYLSGYYLRSHASGFEYVSPEDFGESISQFTGLSDTPSGYVSHSGQYLVVNDGETGINFTGIEKIAQDLTNYGFVGGTSDFTGLLDTPDNYSDGDYLRSTSNGLEYVTASGLAQDIGDEIVNNIVTGDLLAFTGLNDTPENYEIGKFARVNSAGDAIEYSDISFLNDIADAPENQLVSGYLKLDKDGKLVWSPATTDGDVSYTITGATHFTGLLDTPTGYEHGQYLRVHPSDKKLEYISVTGLAQDIGGEIVNNIVTGDLLAFTGLNDTPDSYIGHSGQYAIVNDEETAINFTGIEKIASDLTDYGFGEGSLDIPKYTDLPDATENDGKIVASGCDLYYSCDGEWKKIGADSIPPPEDVPGCVNNLEEYNEYQEYKEQFVADNMGSAAESILNNGTRLSDLTLDVCLFPESNLENEKNTVVIDETTYKWGIFASPQTINLSAVGYSDQIVNCVFREWVSSNVTFEDSTSANTSVFVDTDSSITGSFDCSFPPGQPSCSEILFHLQSNNDQPIDKSTYQRPIENTNNVVSSNDQQLFGGSTFDFTSAQGAIVTEVVDISSPEINGFEAITTEVWINLNDLGLNQGASQTIFEFCGVERLRINGSTNNPRPIGSLFWERGASGGNSAYYFSTDISPLNINQWYHIAVVYTTSNKTHKVYLDGIQIGLIEPISFLLIDGRWRVGGPSGFIKGYLQDFRVSKKEVYTSNFTPPNSLLSNPC